MSNERTALLTLEMLQAASTPDATKKAAQALYDDLLARLPEKENHRVYCDLNQPWSNKEDVSCSCDKEVRDQMIDEHKAILRAYFLAGEGSDADR